MKKSTWIPEAIRFGRDAESGAEIEQLTSEPVTSTNIYCERRYTSADGSRIAIERKPFGRPAELWVCDLNSMRVCQAAQGIPVNGNAPLNVIYYMTQHDGNKSLMRLDLTSLDTSEMFRFSSESAPGGGAVSPDERWFIGGPLSVRDNVFSLLRVDLERGSTDTLCEIEDMFNPHLQFDPADGRLCAVQINRGGRRCNPKTGRMSVTGRLGATLCVVHVESGKITPLPAGRPHTPIISGHECWVGRSGRMIFTAGQYACSASSYVTLKDPPDNERDMPAASIYSVAPGETEARVIARGKLFNHLAASDDGRFFIADDHASGRIYIGDINTGGHIGLCDSHTRQGNCQHSHVHAYLTPDNRYVIFNSIATGTAQVYAARVPDGFLEKVLQA